jgi:hypothetical protein
MQHNNLYSIGMNELAKVGTGNLTKSNSSKWVTVIHVALHLYLLVEVEDWTNSWFNLTHHHEFTLSCWLVGWLQ